MDDPDAQLGARAGLRGRTALVTGGAGGIGAAITEALLACGVAVAVCDSDASACDAFRVEMHDRGLDTNLHVCVADVREPDELDRVFALVDDVFDHLDILVTVPGGLFHSMFNETRPRGWTALIKLNFVQVLDVTHRALERMHLRTEPGSARPRAGSIVHVSTIEGLRGMPGGSVYAAMKAALENFTRTLAVEVGERGVRVNTIAPDMIPTRATIERGAFPDDESTPLARLGNHMMIPMARKGGVDEVANAALFLASDLSSYTTGTTLLVDGGTLAASSWIRWPTGFRNRVPDEIGRVLLENGYGPPEQ